MSSIQLSDEIKTKLKEIQDDIVGDTIGVSQAISEMNKSMDKVNTYLRNHEYEKAAELGYTELSSNFIFLQRCLGGLHRTMMNKDIVDGIVAGAIS